MAEMKFRALYAEGENYIERNVGFNSRDVILYAATADPEVTAVILAKDNVRYEVWVLCTASEFHREKMKAEDRDKHALIKN